MITNAVELYLIYDQRRVVGYSRSLEDAFVRAWRIFEVAKGPNSKTLRIKKVASDQWWGLDDLHSAWGEMGLLRAQAAE
jgi:hypothetical protein